jgi:hypothetical protein
MTGCFGARGVIRLCRFGRLTRLKDQNLNLSVCNFTSYIDSLAWSPSNQESNFHLFLYHIHHGFSIPYQEVRYVIPSPFLASSDFAPILPPSYTPPSTLLLNITTKFICIGVLGATGSVGQRFILLLAQHPHLTLHAIGASSRSAGKKYKDAVRWKQAAPMGDIADMVVRECKADEFKDCDVVFSGLDSDVAGDIGMYPFPLSS